MEDLRSGIDIQYIGPIEQKEGGRNYSETVHKINAQFAGIEIGYLTFTEYIFSDQTSPSYLRIDNIEIILTTFRNLGIGQLMYKKLSEVYEEYYSGWPVFRTIFNPVADYAFNKADSMGWIAQGLKQEQNTTRVYDENAKQKYDQLMQKLPEQYR